MTVGNFQKLLQNLRVDSNTEIRIALDGLHPEGTYVSIAIEDVVTLSSSPTCQYLLINPVAVLKLNTEATP